MSINFGWTSKRHLAVANSWESRKKVSSFRRQLRKVKKRFCVRPPNTDSAVKFLKKMNTQSYFPNYYSIDDIFVTQERVKCRVNTKLIKMGKILWLQKNISLKFVLSSRFPRSWVRDSRFGPKRYSELASVVCKGVGQSTFLF